MSLVPDLSSLDAAANRLEHNADDLRQRVARLVAALGAADWLSPAASVFRGNSERLCGQLRRCADAIDRAAGLLRAHARTARARLGDAAAALTAIGTTAVRTGQTIADDADHVAGAVWHAIGG